MSEDKKLNEGVQEKKSGGLSKIALTEKIRAHVPDLIERALEIAKNGDSDSNKLGAIKLLLSKVLPDLKATELDLGEKTKFIIQLVKEIPLNDRKENPTTNKELSKPAKHI
jgi:hypothetical protein